ncbi:unnamed protein product [Pleuronectes platessa]|uniref:Uncharacterized protein n=1 Tax=Pleuronectes platessa TaxID=8262 RepID=A0A9N7Z1T0_PLEPL|nr:unnamed protein product [Pleuronectes platessa]
MKEVLFTVTSSHRITETLVHPRLSGSASTSLQLAVGLLVPIMLPSCSHSPLKGGAVCPQRRHLPCVCKPCNPDQNVIGPSSRSPGFNMGPSWCRVLGSSRSLLC